MAAFLGDLIPVACAGNPQRYLDYLLFFSAVEQRNSTGLQHWPVLLRYIEATRKERCLDNAPKDEGTDKLRAKHSLLPQPAQGSDPRETLDMRLFNDAVAAWQAGSTPVFLESYVSAQTIAVLSAANTARARLAMDAFPDPLMGGTKPRDKARP